MTITPNTVCHSRWTCPARVENAICHQPIGETNGINDTNGEAIGERLLVPIAPEIKTTCNLGHDHIWTAARFRFSEQRYYYDAETNQKLSIPTPEFGT